MIYKIPTKLVGVSFKNEDGSSRQELIKNLKLTDTLLIEHEPNNQYDQNSHIVKHNDKILGHISRELAKELIEKKQRGEKLSEIVEWKVTGHDKQTLGVNIIMTLDSVEVKKDV